MRQFRCSLPDCEEVSSVEDWNKVTKENLSDVSLFMPLQECFDVLEAPEREGMHFVCPKCEILNDGMYVEEIYKNV